MCLRQRLILLLKFQKVGKGHLKFKARRTVCEVERVRFWDQRRRAQQFLRLLFQEGNREGDRSRKAQQNHRAWQPFDQGAWNWVLRLYGQTSRQQTRGEEQEPHRTATQMSGKIDVGQGGQVEVDAQVDEGVFPKGAHPRGKTGPGNNESPRLAPSKPHSAPEAPALRSAPEKAAEAPEPAMPERKKSSKNRLEPTSFSKNGPNNAKTIPLAKRCSHPMWRKILEISRQ